MPGRIGFSGLAVPPVVSGLKYFMPFVHNFSSLLKIVLAM